MCISATCIDEIAKLTTVTGACTEEATPTRRYKSNLVMTGFPMK